MEANGDRVTAAPTGLQRTSSGSTPAVAMHTPTSRDEQALEDHDRKLHRWP